MRKFINAAVIAAMLMISGKAHAAAVFYDFTAIPTDGPLLGHTLLGSFSIDNSLLSGPSLFNADASGKFARFERVE
jgi:hypothetical protein